MRDLNFVVDGVMWAVLNLELCFFLQYMYACPIRPSERVWWYGPLRLLVIQPLLLTARKHSCAGGAVFLVAFHDLLGLLQAEMVIFTIQVVKSRRNW